MLTFYTTAFIDPTFVILDFSKFRSVHEITELNRADYIFTISYFSSKSEIFLAKKFNSCKVTAGFLHDYDWF